MKRKITYSAKFKRDYIAALAIVIFFSIVVCEITLAISIPAYLNRENAMALEVRRLVLLDNFDRARSTSGKLKVKGGETAEYEARLVAWTLDSLAPYLRENSGRIDSAEIAELQDTVTELTRILTRLADYGPYSVERQIDTSIYLDSLLVEAAP